MTTTETEIETEVETKVETEVATKEKTEVETDVDITELNEIAKTKQKLDYNTDEFEKVKREYAEIKQNNTQLETIEEIEENQKELKQSYLPKKKNKNSNNLKISARLKLFLVCASIVLVLSASLLIYNGVQIAITKSQIASVEREIATGKTSYDSAVRQLKKLTETDELTERAIDLNMEENSQTIKADLIETRLDTPQNENTNWFNDICNFLSNLFGN